MKKVSWNFWRRSGRPGRAIGARVAAGLGIAALLMMAGTAVAQTPTTQAADVPTPAHMSVPDGYTAHYSVDLGGRMSGLSGSEAMYDTLVNMHSGPRVLGESFEMRAAPGKQGLAVDYLKAIGSGFGGDPYNFGKLDAGKGKLFQFQGIFRRDRQYFDYDLLGNPNIVAKTIPVGPVDAPSGSLAWPQVNQSPVLWNTVRRMTDTNLTVNPFSPVTYRFAYSRNTMEGPTLSPSYSIFKYDALLREYQRNGSDNYVVAVDLKPIERTTISVEQHFNRYKSDSFFTLNPNGFLAQEADGRKVYLGNWDSQTPYGIAACNTNSMGAGFTDKTHYTIFSPAQTPGGLPVINAACAVVTSYSRVLPARILLPTSVLRFQSSRVEKLTMNGDIRYTRGTLHMPTYSENVQGLNGAVRSLTYQGGFAQGHRAVIAADFGAIYEVSKTFDIAEQVTFSSAQQPGYSNIPAPTTLSTPTTAGNQTVNYSGPLTGGTGTLPHGINGFLTPGYFGQSFLVNNLTFSWSPLSNSTVSLTYRYGDHKIGQGVPHGGRVDTSTDPFRGTVEIQENGGILNVAVRPTSKWNLNGSVEGLFFDNVLTPVSPRQSWQFRVRSMYKPVPWTTITAAYNDRERHNNTFNNQADVAAGDAEYYGPIEHKDFTRVGSLGAVIAPNEAFSLDVNYSYSDVFNATNICLTNGAAAGLPGTATVNSSGALNLCPGIFARGSTTLLVDVFARDFEEAPTHFGSIAMAIKPSDKVKADFGYRISNVTGTRLYNDARDVAGALRSRYQVPFAGVAWRTRPGLTWKAEYNLNRYSENSGDGAQLCTQSDTATAVVVPCASLPYPTGRTEGTAGLTAPREFRANNVVLGIHYEF